MTKSEERSLLLARAAVARRLVKDGVLDGYTALSYAVWPTRRILECEQRCSASTISFRAVSWRNEHAA